MNSERIERCFGSYGLELLPSRSGLRVALLYSGTADQRIARTLALTGFVPAPDADLSPSMQRIEAGASIGSTLKAAGWSVGKQTIDLEWIPVGTETLAWTGLNEPSDGAGLALHIYRLTAERGGETHLVARIAELHHPDYLTLADLDRLFPERLPPGTDDRAFMRQVRELLAR
ncbi:hypothetical protein [Elongatibacter sediminis]|uniref:Uncharacterized protein n=1 Tax=Elongatibacter sediminis TaxID=3119006 RepID=A0AAW9R4U9_9GAMM